MFCIGGHSAVPFIPSSPLQSVTCFPFLDSSVSPVSVCPCSLSAVANSLSATASEAYPQQQVPWGQRQTVGGCYEGGCSRQQLCNASVIRDLMYVRLVNVLGGPPSHVSAAPTAFLLIITSGQGTSDLTLYTDRRQRAYTVCQ
ncbi:hypothetical protein Hypma_005081 [Hypsizygus marmoreus]|uniref:Uncharacterized protein n=1 Tax=Hypsizygus marmoreus TaxID=39966 RepID=A0A369K5B1_HYPMA|nr:hypothetical protein Hypma_005081 [Hypsizygus marmoreus]